MQIRSLVRRLAAAVLISAPTVALAAVSAADYRASLLEIYGKYQGVLALREACNSAFPQAQAANEKAFAAWQKRHRRLHDELDQRFAMMVRAYSKDDKDYSRNYGKYQGAVLRQREEAKQSLLMETRGDLEARCKGLPEFLQGRESDLESEFASEWIVLRQWPLPSK
jgi:hypothetical protein